MPLALDQVEEAAETFKKRGLKAVVICFLFSFLNNEHEAKARDIVKRVMPEAFVCCSHEVVNAIREYERFASTAMNAYIGPTVALYLERLEGRLREHGVKAAVRIMQSNGGISTVENSSRPGRIVTIAATPVGSDYTTALTQAARVLVTPPPAPPSTAGAPIASVSYSPAAPKAGEMMTFDASSSTAAAGRSIVTFVWDFGDGTANDEHGSDASRLETDTSAVNVSTSACGPRKRSRTRATN